MPLQHSLCRLEPGSLAVEKSRCWRVPLCSLVTPTGPPSPPAPVSPHQCAQIQPALTTPQEQHHESITHTNDLAPASHGLAPLHLLKPVEPAHIQGEGGGPGWEAGHLGRSRWRHRAQGRPGPAVPVPPAAAGRLPPSAHAIPGTVFVSAPACRPQTVSWWCL